MNKDNWRQRGRFSEEDWARIRAAHEAAQLRKFAKPVRPYPTAFGYTRCSHTDSESSGLGREAQQRIILGQFQILQVQHSDIVWGDFWHDTAQSAYKGRDHRFADRPAGSKLYDMAQAGDHLIVAIHDRAFRDVMDCLTTVKQLGSREVFLHICDHHIDTSTANGRAMLTMAAVFAQWESDVKSERTKAGLASVRARRQPVGGNDKPLGFRWIGEKGKRVLVPDPYERSIMGEVVRLREAGMSWWDTADAIENGLALAEGREPIPRNWGPQIGKPARDWGRHRIENAYYAEMRLRAAKVTEDSATCAEENNVQ